MLVVIESAQECFNIALAQTARDQLVSARIHYEWFEILHIDFSIRAFLA